MFTYEKITISINYLSRCNKQIRSLATFSFFAIIFLKFSTVITFSTTTENVPPVVVDIFTVIAGAAKSVPHPSIILSLEESLPDEDFSIFDLTSNTLHYTVFRKQISRAAPNRMKNFHNFFCVYTLHFLH